MKKRVIAVLTAVLMTASLVGCGSGKLSNDYVTVNKYKGNRGCQKRGVR